VGGCDGCGGFLCANNQSHCGKIHPCQRGAWAWRPRPVYADGIILQPTHPDHSIRETTCKRHRKRPRPHTRQGQRVCPLRQPLSARANCRLCVGRLMLEGTFGLIKHAPKSPEPARFANTSAQKCLPSAGHGRPANLRGSRGVMESGCIWKMRGTAPERMPWVAGRAQLGHVLPQVASRTGAKVKPRSGALGRDPASLNP
jgi:hypothetical protein